MRHDATRSASISTTRRRGNTLFGGLAASGWPAAALTKRLLVDGGAPLAAGLIGAGGEVVQVLVSRLVVPRRPG